MPEFVLDTTGEVPEPKWERPPMVTVGRPLTWRDLDSFTQGYIEALFFTEGSPAYDSEEWHSAKCQKAQEEGTADGNIPGDVGFSDLAPETLARILKDCREFQETDVWRDFDHARANADPAPTAEDEQAGRDFWFTRNGHGVGFWDRDPEVYRDFAKPLTKAAEAMGNVDAYLGDDGKVYLS